MLFNFVVVFSKQDEVDCKKTKILFCASVSQISQSSPPKQKMVNKCSVILQCVSLCFLFAEIVFGSLEIHYSLKYKHLNYLCSQTFGNLRLWIFAAGIVTVVSAVFNVLFVSFQMMFPKDNTEDTDAERRNQFQLCHIAKLLISVWAMVVFYKLRGTTTCEWTQVSILMTFVRVHVILFYVAIGLIGLSLCLLGGVLCCGLFSADAQQQPTRIQPLMRV